MREKGEKTGVVLPMKSISLSAQCIQKQESQQSSECLFKSHLFTLSTIDASNFLKHAAILKRPPEYGASHLVP